MKVIGFTGLLKSLTYILLCGVRPSVGGGFGPLGTRGLVPVIRNLCAGFVTLRPLWAHLRAAAKAGGSGV